MKTIEQINKCVIVTRTYKPVEENFKPVVKRKTFRSIVPAQQHLVDMINEHRRNGWKVVSGNSNFYTIQKGGYRQDIYIKR